MKRDPEEIWRRAMAETLGLALSQLEAARAGAGVHGARRQLKRARSLLRLAKPVLKIEDFAAANRALKRAADCLAVTRRAEAMGEAIAKLAPKTGKPPAVVAALAGIAEATRQQTAVPADLDRATAEACAAIAAVQAMMPDLRPINGGHKPYLKAFRQTYAKTQRLLAQGLAANNSDTLHEARKFAIRHLHHLEFLAPLWPQLFKAWAAEVQHLRQALGDLHDLAELQALLAEDASPYGELAEKKEALLLIKKRHKQLLRRIEKRSPRIFTEQPKALAQRVGATWR